MVNQPNEKGETIMNNAAKGKRQLTLTLTETAYERLQVLAEETDRTVPGYIRWILNEYLRELDKSGYSR